MKTPLAFARFQERFARALNRPGGALPGLFAADEDIAFAVYRNNVWSAWQESLKTAYPVITRILGEEAMNLAARRFCHENPPRQGDVLAFGLGFDIFIASSELAGQLPWLACLAQLEHARLEAMISASAPRLALTDFDPAGDFSTMVLPLHPSVRLLALDWPVEALWQAHQQQDVPELTIAPEKCELLIIREKSGHVAQRALQPGGIALMTALAEGQNLADAYSHTAALGFDFAAHMKLCFELGAFAADVREGPELPELPKLKEQNP